MMGAPGGRSFNAGIAVNEAKAKEEAKKAAASQEEWLKKSYVVKEGKLRIRPGQFTRKT